MHRLRGRTAALFAALMLGVAAAGRGSADAVSYPPLPNREGWSVAPDTGRGGTVFLFHGGDEGARRALHAGDVLEVMRCGSGGGMTAAGKIRLAALTAGPCIRAVVLEGWVRANDVVTAGGAAFLVIPEIPLCRPPAGP